MHTTCDDVNAVVKMKRGQSEPSVLGEDLWQSLPANSGMKHETVVTPKQTDSLTVLFDGLAEK